LLFGTEDLLLVRIWQLHHLSFFRRRGIATAARAAEAGGHLCGNRALSADGLLRTADALRELDRGPGDREDRFLLDPSRRLGRGNPVRQSVQYLEGVDRARDRRGPRLDRSSQRLSL